MSLRLGNRLVGNADNAAALEMTLIGGAFRFAARRRHRSDRLRFRRHARRRAATAVGVDSSATRRAAASWRDAFRRALLSLRPRRHRRPADSRQRIHASPQRTRRLEGRPLRRGDTFPSRRPQNHFKNAAPTRKPCKPWRRANSCELPPVPKPIGSPNPPNARFTKAPIVSQKIPIAWACAWKAPPSTASWRAR